MRLETQFGLGHQECVVEHLLDALASDAAGLEVGGLSAVVFRCQVEFHQLLHCAVEVELGLVFLVDRHDDWRVRRLCVGHGLFGTGLNPIITGNHQHHHVHSLGTAGAHGAEGLVTGGVDDGQGVVVRSGDLIGADVLGDASGFAVGNLGGTDLVHQGGLAVVHMTQEGQGRGAVDQVPFFQFGALGFDLFQV